MKGEAPVGRVPQVAQFLSWEVYIGQKINITKTSELTYTFFLFLLE